MWEMYFHTDKDLHFDIVVLCETMIMRSLPTKLDGLVYQKKVRVTWQINFEWLRNVLKNRPKEHPTQKNVVGGKSGNSCSKCFYKVMYETEELLDRDLDW